VTARPLADVDTAPVSDAPLLAIEGLSVRFETERETVHAVTELAVEVEHGEVFALVGESGSGKSVTALSVMGLLPTPPARVTGSIRLQGRELMGMSRRELNSVRGREIGMVFQDPMSSLNPVHPIGRQIGESLRLHFDLGRREAVERAVDLLDQVGIPDAKRRVKDFPHEFSGGMRQRAMIAMALACDPKLLIADEPTTALDVTVQNQIVELVRTLQQDRGLSVVWITHDLGVVAEIADRVAVMYGGRIMETSDAADVYRHARHPYTSGLLRSIPRLDREAGSRLSEIPGTPRTVTEPLDACAFGHRCPIEADDCASGLPELGPTDRPAHLSACIHHSALTDGERLWRDEPIQRGAAQLDDRVLIEIEGLEVHFPVRRGLRGDGLAVRAVDGVDLEVRRGRTLGIVGESGCGKTTLGRSLVRLVEPTSGEIRVDGVPLGELPRSRRRAIQMIFQDPFSSMNPGMRIRDVIAEPMRIHALRPAEAFDDRVAELLEQVGLSPEAANRHPHEFSGGQRQRIAVARALAAEPEVIVCDEPVSALDVSVQAQIVNLLADLQASEGIGLVFIAHDLAVVRHISDEVAVMYLGQIVERAPRDELYNDPQHPYTKALLAAVPVPDPTIHRSSSPLVGDLPSPSNPPDGCRFHTRCPVSIEGLCATEPPKLRSLATHRQVACHLVDSQDPQNT
jgi:peptide/nickel transport system ATP-binding protein